jgi:hypothetical protein
MKPIAFPFGHETIDPSRIGGLVMWWNFRISGIFRRPPTGSLSLPLIGVCA